MVMTRKPIIIAVVVLLLGIVALGYFLIDEDADTSPKVTIPVPPEVPSPPSSVEDEPDPGSDASEEDDPLFVLPLLDDSDALVRDGVLDMTRNEDINAWLGVDNLIRKFVASVDNLAQGQIAKEPAQVMTPRGKFLVTPIDDETWYLNTESYARYNLFGDIVESIDARRAAEFYLLIRFLLQDAYDDLGYGNQSFDARLFQAIGRLLETPVIDKPIRLVRPGVFYEFEDPRLEALSGAQKQMLRMGPDNTRHLQAKLSEVALELRPLLDE